MAIINDESKTNGILVTGDLIRDFNIIRQPVNPTGYRDSLSSTVMEAQAGGAWYLADLIRMIHHGLITEIAVPDYESDEKLNLLKINKAYQIWSKIKEINEGKEKSVWRVENFLGCEKYRDKNLNETKYAESFITGKAPHMVVIDDVSLGFVDNKATIEELLTRLQDADNIILKTHSPQFNSLLWSALANKGLLYKTTVVITADSLREGGAYITRGFSWDKTIEEAAKEFDNGHYSIVFSKCKRVIVLFDKFGIASFTNVPLATKFNGSDISDTRLSFERFVFDRQNYEGAWDKRFCGSIYGSLSILTAAVTLLYADEKYALSYIFSLALNCIQKNVELGGGSEKTLDFSKINDFIRIAFSLNRTKNKKEKSKENQIVNEKEPQKEFKKQLRKFYSSHPCYYKKCEYGLKKSGNSFKSNLLGDVAGYNENFLYSKAVEIVMRGPDEALRQVPMAKFGKYQTYDREEIERINSVHNMIRVYLSHPSDDRPLSFAVFGAPGSGKSFAIKQLLESIFGKSNEPMIFNLTQFRDTSDLHQALHIVRDRTVKGAMPLVFWDEFDNNSNRWLTDFLAPMQDGEFSEGGNNHPLGRAIFVFAGGTNSSFEDYQEIVMGKKELKGPDFISRLRGFVNIKGPNKLETSDTTSDNDDAYIIRRALLIYSHLKKHHAPIFEKNNVPSISPGVVNALLKTKKYQHGARSIESIISLSRTGNNKQFDTSSLPSPELLKIHTSDDFISLVHEGELEYPLIEIMAEAIHNQWKTEKESLKRANGEPFYVWGPSRTDGPEKFTHPRLMDYRKLEEEWKEVNRITARLTKAKFAIIGYQVIPSYLQENTDLEIEYVVNSHRKELIEMEHDTWLRGHLIDGYEYDETTNDDILLHKDIAKMAVMNNDEICLDDAIINATVNILKSHNYKLRKIQN